MKMYGLNVSSWIVHLCMGIGCVLPKCSPVNVVVSIYFRLGSPHHVGTLGPS